MAITNITEALEALKDLAEGLPAAVTVDDTLSVEGAAADAKAVGDEFGAISTFLSDLYTTSTAHILNKSNPHSVTAAQVGAAPAYSYGTADMTSGTSALETGKLYFVHE